MPDKQIQLYEYLSRFITENKRSKIEEIVLDRTRYITVVLEDIFQPHNASAVLRTCECFGIQDVHIIENKNKYAINPDVVMGSTKWMSLFKYGGKENNTKDCLHTLRKNGYRIAATSPHKTNCDINDIDIAKGKIALVMGTEINGVTNDVMELADEFVTIPMFGFTESFNISVTAAICLHILSGKLRNSAIQWKLPQAEQLVLKTDWVKNILTKPELIEEEFWKTQS